MIVKLKPEDLITTTYSSERRGSWNLNHTDTGIAIYHKPTGLQVMVNDHKSQHKNRNDAIIKLEKLLEDDLYE